MGRNRPFAVRGWECSWPRVFYRWGTLVNDKDWIKTVEANRRIVSYMIAADRKERTARQKAVTYRSQVNDPRSAYWQVVCAGYAKAGAPLVAFRYEGPCTPQNGWSNKDTA